MPLVKGLGQILSECTHQAFDNLFKKQERIINCQDNLNKTLIFNAYSQIEIMKIKFNTAKLASLDIEKF